MTIAQDYVVRPVGPDDRTRWQQLYEGYLDFYETGLTQEQLQTVWSWLLDEDHAVCGFLVEGPEGVVGLAHYREFHRPSSASVGGFLDDLYVTPAARGAGVVDALLDAMKRLGGERGWTVIRWITADDNYRARSKYDQMARRTTWITYDMSTQTSSAQRE